MAFKDAGRWQEQLCDTSNHRISGGSSSGLFGRLWITTYSWWNVLNSNMLLWKHLHSITSCVLWFLASKWNNSCHQSETRL